MCSTEAWRAPQRHVGGGAPGPKEVQPDTACAGGAGAAVRLTQAAESTGLTLRCPHCSGKLSGELLAPRAGDNNCIENSGEAEGL